MAQEYRTSQYWGAGAEGKWFMDSMNKLKHDARFNGSIMNFVRYAVRYCLQNDKSLGKKISAPGG